MISAVERDDEEARLAAETSSSSSCSSDSDDSVSNPDAANDAIDVGGDAGAPTENARHDGGADKQGTVEGQTATGDQAAASGHSRRGKGGVAGPNGGDGGTSGGASSGNVSVSMRWKTKRQRGGELGERVMRASAQCQACLYDVAMIPCAVSGVVGEG